MTDLTKKNEYTIEVEYSSKALMCRWYWRVLQKGRYDTLEYLSSGFAMTQRGANEKAEDFCRKHVKSVRTFMA